MARPKAVRNFWITTAIDGRTTVDTSGPCHKDGGFGTTIKVHQNGDDVPGLLILGETTEDGKLRLRAIDGRDFTVIWEREFER